ncbi:MAG: YndJ family protein [Planctomycetes bacterium]|nr:YndJ family protein [Planctomycetota bacterium]
MSTIRKPGKDRHRRQFAFDAALGALAWIVIVGRQLGHTQSGQLLIEHLLLFAPLVIVPLGVRLTSGRTEGRKHPLAFVAASNLHPLATLAAVGAVLLEPGLPSGFAAGIWGAYCSLLALWGCLRFFGTGQRSLAEVAIEVGLVYSAIGGVWFVLSRMGLQPLEFPHAIVALTSVHFHYAGFAAPIIVGLAGRVLGRSGPPHVLWRIGARAVIVCPIVIAIGITTAPIVEVIAAFGLAIALTMSMMVVAVRAGPALGVWPGILIWKCAISLSLTMVLACIYALGEFTGTPWIDIEHMALIHGLVNVFGFALPGMLAWTIADPPRVQ